MSLWDDIKDTASDATEAATDAVSDAADTVTDGVSDAVEATGDRLDEWADSWTEPETGTFTPAPPDGPYDISAVPTSSEILTFVDGFEPSVQHAMIREVAKELYSDYAGMIDLSAEEWEDYKSAYGNDVTVGGDGLSTEHFTVFKWHDELDIVLPTNKGMDYYAGKERGPDPDEAVPGILSEGEARGRTLMADLRSSCKDALSDANLEAICHTAQYHSKLYQEMDAAVDELASLITKMEDLGRNWEGNDAELYQEQYGDAVSPALNRHRAIALNLRRAADSDLGIEVALHYAIAGSLQTGKERIAELSTKQLFGDGALSILTVASLAIGVVSLYPALGTGVATAVGISGLLVTGGAAAGMDFTINPETDTLPSSEQIREVIETMTQGFAKAKQDAIKMRFTCDDELSSLSIADRALISKPTMVPGCGY